MIQKIKCRFTDSIVFFFNSNLKSSMKSTHFKLLFAGTGMVVAGLSAVDAQERPNILWLTIEDTSPYDFGCYGNKYVSTPNIDHLAKTGIQYMQAHSVGPQSSPSRSGIITGSYCSTYGMDWHRMKVDTPDDIFLPKFMREAGYFCTNKTKTDYNTKVNNKSMWDECSAEATYNNPKRKKDQPFFAVFNTMATHMGRVRSFHTDGRRDFSLSGLDPHKLDLPPHVPDIPEIRSDFAFHMEGTQDIDSWVKIFLDDLKKHNLEENTIIFFFSDHGGCLPRGKGFLYETGTRIPFIVYIPPKWEHLANGMSGQTNRLIGLPDIAPTVLSLAGVKPPMHMQGKAFLGKYEDVPKTYEFGVKANQASHFCPERSVTDGRYKYIARYIPYKHDALMNAYQWGMPSNIYWDNAYLNNNCKTTACSMPFEQYEAELFFDLEKDPYEIDNQINNPAYQKDLIRLKAEMSNFLRETKDLGFFTKSQRIEKGSLYDKVRKQNYDFNKLFELVEMTAKVTSGDLPYLTTCLKSSQKEIRYWAVVNICQLAVNKQIREAPGELLDLIRIKDGEVSSEAAYALALLGHEKEAMKYLSSIEANGQLSAAKITILELMAINKENTKYFTEDVRKVVRQIATLENTLSEDTESDSEEGYSTAARKILINLREIPATSLWGKNYYQEGLKINKDRRKLVPTPF